MRVVASCCGHALGFSDGEYLTGLFSFRYTLDANMSCTVVGKVDSRGLPLLGKTDDIERQERGMNVMEVCRPDSGHAFVHFHFAGTNFTVAGMNVAGLAIGMTGIPGAIIDDDAAPGLFSLVALNTVLPLCNDVQDVISHLEALPVDCYGFSLVVGDAGGRLALLEKTSAGMSVLPAPFAHTNTILDPALAAQGRTHPPAFQANTDARLRTAIAMLGEGSSLEEIVCSRGSGEGGGPISQAGDDELDMHTDFALVCSPMERTIQLWAGTPHLLEGPELIDVAGLLAGD